MLRTTNCCENPDCRFCVRVSKLCKSPDVIKYMQSDAFGDEKLRIDSAQCDNHLGWQKFARNILGIPANVCKSHILGNVHVFIITIFYRFSPFASAGIAAVNYSHVQYFKKRKTYDDFYCKMLRVVKIGVLSLARAVQTLLVEYLCTIDPDAADWYRDNWCGERGRHCLCHVPCSTLMSG